MTMTLIETKTLATAVTAIEFTSIPQTGADLFLTVSARGGAGTDFPTYQVRFNGTTTGYLSRSLSGNGSTRTSATGGTANITIGNIPGSVQAANNFDNAAIYIRDYTAAVNKPVSIDQISENNATFATQRITSGLWSNTAAITSLEVLCIGLTLAVGSTVSLYRITRGSDGIVVVS